MHLSDPAAKTRSKNTYISTDFIGKKSTETTPPSVYELDTYEAVKSVKKSCTRVSQPSLPPSLEEGGMYENVDALKATLAKTMPLPVPPESERNKVAVNQNLYQSTAAVNGTSVLANPLPAPPASEEKDTTELDLYECVDTIVNVVKDEQKQNPVSPLAKEENSTTALSSCSPAPAVTYTAVLLRGKSLRSHLTGNDTDGRGRVDQETHADTTEPDDAETSRDRKLSESERNENKEYEEEDGCLSPPSLPPETAEKYIADETCPPCSAGTDSDTASNEPAETGGRQGLHDEENIGRDETSEQNSKDDSGVCTGEDRVESTESNRGMANAKEEKEEGKVKEKEAEKKKEEPEDKVKSEETKEDETGASKQERTEDMKGANVPALPPETNAKYILVGSWETHPHHQDQPHPPQEQQNIPAYTTENLYEDCSKIRGPDPPPASAPITLKQTLSAQQSARKLRRNKLASSNEKPSSPSSMRKISPATQATSPLAISHAATLPSNSATPASHAATPSLQLTPSGQEYMTNEHSLNKGSPGMFHTLRPRRKSKEEAKIKPRKTSFEDKQVVTFQPKEAGSNLTSRARSMTSLLEKDQENEQKKTGKGNSLKAAMGLWMKKTLNRAESLVSVVERDEDAGNKDRSVVSRQKMELPHEEERQRDTPAAIPVAIPVSSAQSLKCASQDLVYAEVNTNARFVVPIVSKPSHKTTPKRSLKSKEFPTVSELENEAGRKQSRSRLAEDAQYEIITNSPRNRAKPPQPEAARGPANSTEYEVMTSNQAGKGKPAQEDELYEVMANPSKPPTVPVEEQIYEQMIGNTQQQTREVGGKSAVPTADEEYEVMANIRPPHLK